MTTGELYTIIDYHYTNILDKYNFTYSLKKIRNHPEWRVEIGKFNKITDAYIQGYISPNYNFLKQFKDILQIAAEDKSVNY